MSDEKKITLEELENLLEDESGSGNSGLNFQTIFAALVLNWQWFLLSLVICVWCTHLPALCRTRLSGVSPYAYQGAG